VNFTTWVNTLLWILTLVIVEEINAYRFWSNDNHSPTNGIRVTGLKFKTRLARAAGEIVGQWVEHFP
jgi:hypothetical protein